MRLKSDLLQAAMGLRLQQKLEEAQAAQASLSRQAKEPHCSKRHLGARGVSVCSERLQEEAVQVLQDPLAVLSPCLGCHLGALVAAMCLFSGRRLEVWAATPACLRRSLEKAACVSQDLLARESPCLARCVRIPKLQMESRLQSAGPSKKVVISHARVRNLDWQPRPPRRSCACSQDHC